MHKLIIASAVLIAACCSIPIAQGQGRIVEVGDTVDYTFSQPPIDGLGLMSLRDLRGKPILVEFWGTR